MTYAEAITELFRRADRRGVGRNDFADQAGMSGSHLSHIIHGKAPGSEKTLKEALSYYGWTLEDAISLPPDPATTTEADQALSAIKEAIAIGGDMYDRVVDFADSLKIRMDKTRSTKPPSRERKKMSGKKDGKAAVKKKPHHRSNGMEEGAEAQH